MKWNMPLPLVLMLAANCCLIVSSSGSSSGVFSEQIQSLIQSLANRQSSLDKIQEAQLWRRLGKLQLDSGEYAEARRIFCHGSECCPSDDGLLHHVRVWDTFHADKTKSASISDSSLSSTPPPLSAPLGSDVFLSLEVPVGAIPQSVKNWKGRIPQSERVRLIHASKDPVLSIEACQFLINAALDTVKKRGWTKDRHVQAPTCDVPVFDLPPDAKLWCRNAFEHALFPLLALTVAPELDIDAQDLRVLDCFVVRYDAGDGPGFSDLRPHEDESLLSLTIALNDMDEYDGGGLFIAPTGDLLNGNAGTVLCFAGGIVHGGYPVSKGTRWILTVFLYVDANESGKQPGYTLDALRKEGAKGVGSEKE